MRILAKSYAEKFLRQNGVFERYQQKIYEETGVLLSKTETIRALSSTARMMAYNIQEVVLRGENVHFRRWRIYNKPKLMKKYKKRR